jgi:hypothetical protein
MVIEEEHIHRDIEAFLQCYLMDVFQLTLKAVALGCLLIGRDTTISEAENPVRVTEVIVLRNAADEVLRCYIC